MSSNVNLLLANATGTLNRHKKIIEAAFHEAVTVCKEKIDINTVDVIVVDASYNVIPEIGVGGYTPAENVIYISIDSTFNNLQEKDIFMTMVHEMHHAMRWRKPGYGNTLKDALITEGLAALFEEEITGERPLYAKAELSKKSIEAAHKHLSQKDYNHFMWFITGDKTIPRWFGYSYGYHIAKRLSKKLSKTAGELVQTDLSKEEIEKP